MAKVVIAVGSLRSSEPVPTELIPKGFKWLSKGSKVHRNAYHVNALGDSYGTVDGLHLEKTGTFLAEPLTLMSSAQLQASREKGECRFIVHVLWDSGRDSWCSLGELAPLLDKRPKAKVKSIGAKDSFTGKGDTATLPTKSERALQFWTDKVGAVVLIDGEIKDIYFGEVGIILEAGVDPRRRENGGAILRLAALNQNTSKAARITRTSEAVELIGNSFVDVPFEVVQFARERGVQVADLMANQAVPSLPWAKPLPTLDTTPPVRSDNGYEDIVDPQRFDLDIGDDE